MSDYLVKCLWKGVADVDQQQDAADRIEELEAKLEMAEAKLEMAEAKLAKAEAKLAKAMKALVQMVGKRYYADDPWEIASVTLAKLKGQNNE
jgi:outer membrane protein TolC